MAWLGSHAVADKMVELCHRGAMMAAGHAGGGGMGAGDSATTTATRERGLRGLRAFDDAVVLMRTLADADGASSGGGGGGSGGAAATLSLLGCGADLRSPAARVTALRALRLVVGEGDEGDRGGAVEEELRRTACLLLRSQVRGRIKRLIGV